jgi:hypothetical protein
VFEASGRTRKPPKIAVLLRHRAQVNLYSAVSIFGKLTTHPLRFPDTTRINAAGRDVQPESLQRAWKVEEKVAKPYESRIFMGTAAGRETWKGELQGAQRL